MPKKIEWTESEMKRMFDLHIEKCEKPTPLGVGWIA